MIFSTTPDAMNVIRAFRAAARRVALAGICLALAACGGQADVPPETVPVVVTQPADQAVVVGSAASFGVVASGAEPLAYQWASSVDGVTFTAIAGAVGSSYVTGATTQSQSGSFYRVVVSNGIGSATSSSARLTVSPALVAPAIAVQPADRSVVAPATATFTADASGVPAPTVQWQQSTDSGVTWANIAAATGASYTTPASTLADSGKRFRAVFTNSAGSATSNAAILTVTAAPVLTLNTPNDVAFDAAGNIYVADTDNHTIRKITTAGVASTLAGLAGSAGSADGTGSAARFDTPRSLVVDAAGNLYVADTFNNTIRKITPAGAVTTLAGLAGASGATDATGSAARFSSPHGLAIDAAGNLYVAGFSPTIRKITPAGDVSTLAGSAGSTGNVDGAGSAARFRQPLDLALDSAGNVYVADGGGNAVIRKITAAGVVTTLAGLAGSFGSADGLGPAARFGDPRGIAVDAADNIYVSDRSNHNVRKVTLAGDVTTLAGLAGSPGSADGTGTAARFNRPLGVAVDALGNVYVADSVNRSIRKITPGGVVTTAVQ